MRFSNDVRVSCDASLGAQDYNYGDVMTENKESPFEGVRANYFFADGIEEHFLELKDSDGVKWRLRFSGGGNALDVLNELASRWDAYEANQRLISTMKARIKELTAKEPVAQENSTLRDENQRLKELLDKPKYDHDTAVAALSSVETLQKEISRLKEENERLKAMIPPEYTKNCEYPSPEEKSAYDLTEEEQKQKMAQLNKRFSELQKQSSGGVEK